MSAIGHENDHPLLDDVADVRASTPTDAAKRIVPDVGEQRALVARLGVPAVELPLLPGGVDLGGLYELAERLCEEQLA